MGCATAGYATMFEVSQWTMQSCWVSSWGSVRLVLIWLVHDVWIMLNYVYITISLFGLESILGSARVIKLKYWKTN